MEFMEGVHVTDTEGLRRLGLRTSDVANLVSETFSEMIFVFGDVHADPHEKNLLVARGGDGRPRLVLLDHGLYRRITPEFRRGARAYRIQTHVFGVELTRRILYTSSTTMPHVCTNSA